MPKILSIYKQRWAFYTFGQVSIGEGGCVLKTQTNGDGLMHRPRQTRFKKAFYRDWQLYLLCIPALIFIFIFYYGPMYGVQIAFKNFRSAKGIWGSPWVGFDHFQRFFKSPQFKTILPNTLRISIYSLLAGFPFPILIALLLNQVQHLRFKKAVQTTLYAPHFISVVVLASMITVFLAPATGIVNIIMRKMGLEAVHFMAVPEYFEDIFVWSGIWQSSGWGSIIYIAALSAVNPELYEAAEMDGASRFQKIIHVDIPSILPTIVTMFILRTGQFMNVGFQKAFLLQNSLNLSRSEIISTYVYKIGLMDGQFSYSTAINLFNTIVNIILILSVNFISQKLTETSLW